MRLTVIALAFSLVFAGAAHAWGITNKGLTQPTTMKVNKSSAFYEKNRYIPPSAKIFSLKIYLPCTAKMNISLPAPITQKVKQTGGSQRASVVFNSGIYSPLNCNAWTVAYSKWILAPETLDLRASGQGWKKGTRQSYVGTMGAVRTNFTDFNSYRNLQVKK